MSKPLVYLSVAAAILLALTASCPAQQPGVAVGPMAEAKPKSTWTTVTDSVSSTFKKGVSAISKPFESSTPKIDPSDPTSLSAKADPSAELYVAIARTREESGDSRGAEEHFKKAIDVSPQHLGAALGYGRFLDRRGRIEEALRCYHRAIKEHPRDATPLNHLALCLASHGLPERAAPYLERAVKLAPQDAVYRNNLAMVLVEQGKNEAAFRHLVAVHDEATAYYNLGYLLQKRGDTDAARKHFAIAVRCNPKFQEAQAWLAHLEQMSPEPPRASAQVAARPDWSGPAGPGHVGPSPPRNDAAPVRAVAPPQGPYDASAPSVMSQPSVVPPGIVPQGAPPAPTPGLHQPAGATAPVYQTNPLRRDSQWPQPVPRTPPAAPGGPTVDARPVPGADGSGGAWSPGSSAAPLPNSQRVPAASAYGTPRANVVYPLPPVIETSPAVRPY